MVAIGSYVKKIQYIFILWNYYDIRQDFSDKTYTEIKY